MLPEVIVITPGVSSDAASRLRKLAERAKVAVVEGAEVPARFLVASPENHQAIESALLWALLEQADAALAAATMKPSFLPDLPKDATCEVLAPLTRDNQPIRDAGFQVGARVTFECAPVGWIAHSGQQRATVVDPWQRVRVVAEQPPQEVRSALSELYPAVRHPTAAAQAGCPGGPIAWDGAVANYICYYCRRVWPDCVGIAKRGKDLHAGCTSSGLPMLRTSAEGLVHQARIVCRECDAAWAPFPLLDQSKACEEESRRKREAFLSRDIMDVQAADDAANGARLRMCRSFGGFVHGDEGLGCWRCGADRQAHS